MNTPNPLLPQGALEAQATSKRSMIKIVVSTILAIHGVVLGGLLFLGCKEEAPNSEVQIADSRVNDLEPIESNPDPDDPFAGLGLPNTTEPVDIPGLNDRTNRTELPPFPPGGGNSGFTVEPKDGKPFAQPGNERPPTTPGGTAVPGEPLVPEIEDMTTYVVLPGDNFTKIANKHNLKPADISAANPGVDSRRLQVGQVLNLPPNVRAVTPVVPESGGQKTTNETTYTVKSGDTLTRISKTYGVSIADIQKANNIKGSRINVGQKLVIPVPSN